MSRCIFVPALGEQFASVYKRGLIYKGKDGTEFDMKFFTERSHFKHDAILQSCFYGINGVGKNCKTTFRELIGYPKDKLFISDSAGYQVATFKIRGQPCNIEPIDSLRWQEENADIGMNLDIPPTLGKVADYDYFKYSLSTSVDNFRFFEKNRQNYKMKLYNVLHGEHVHLMELWWKAVKDFNFDGWAIGMKPPWDSMIQAMGFMFLWEKGEFDKESFKGLHFFGTSGKHVVPTLVYLASKLKNKIVTYDSSSYNVGSIYRTYYSPYDLGPHLYFGDKFSRFNPHIKELPCDCPVCKSITSIDELNTGDIYAGTLISLHNLYQYKIYNQLLNNLVDSKELFLDYLRKINIDARTLKSIEFIDFAIDKGFANAVEVFKHDLIPQELNKTKQVGVFDF